MIREFLRKEKIMDKAIIEQKANETLQLTQLNEDVESVDIIDIAKKLGFVVGNAGLEDDVDGFIIVEKGKDELLGQNTDRIIGVNATKELNWKRFIIAHEIGHFRLHYNENENSGIYAHREHKKGKNEQENEADFFAACILMPRERFVRKAKELMEKGLTKDEMIILLADKFCVTHKMTERRFGELGIDV